MKFSKEKKQKIRKIKLKKIQQEFNYLCKGSIYLPTQINFKTDDMTLYLLSKFEHNGHYYLLCRNEILHKVNVYELGCYSYYPYTYIRILTDNQVQKRLQPFREWLKRVNFKERRYCVKYILRDTGKIDMRSTTPHLC